MKQARREREGLKGKKITLREKGSLSLSLARGIEREAIGHWRKTKDIIGSWRSTISTSFAKK